MSAATAAAMATAEAIATAVASASAEVTGNSELPFRTVVFLCVSARYLSRGFTVISWRNMLENGHVDCNWPQSLC